VGFCRNLLIYFDRLTQERGHRRADAAVAPDATCSWIVGSRRIPAHACV